MASASPSGDWSDYMESYRTPEERLWLAFLVKNVLDAMSMTKEDAAALHDNSKDRFNRRDARYWFEKREMTVTGWGWIIRVLKLSPEAVQHIERRVHSNEVVAHPFVPKSQLAAKAVFLSVVRVKEANLAVLAVQLAFRFTEGLAVIVKIRGPRVRRPCSDCGCSLLSFWP